MVFRKIKINNNTFSKSLYLIFLPSSDQLVQNFIYATLMYYIRCKLSAFLFKELQMLHFVTMLLSEQRDRFEYFLLFVEKAISRIGIMFN